MNQADPMLVVDGEVRVGDLDLRLAIDAAPGETVAVIGPNGTGKTTLLRTIAGLHGLRNGRVEIAGRTCDEPTGRRWVEPEHRAVGYQFQDPLLFEHLDVLANVAFGPRSRGAGRREAVRIARDTLTALGVEHLAGRLPSALSGGEAQRVALARAVATDPALLLLDEPAGALDQGGRSDLRSLVGDLDMTTVVVSHDPIDVWALADRVVLASGGEVRLVGTPDDLVEAPPNRFVADLFGANVLVGTAAGTEVRLASGFVLATATAFDGDVFATFSPTAVALHDERPHTTARNVWTATIEARHDERDVVRLRLGGAVPVWAAVTPASADSLELRPGTRCWASVKATEIAVRAA